MIKKIILIILGLIHLSFYMYLWYKVLQHINATELMWFLYILLIPLSIVITVLGELIKSEE